MNVCVISVNAFEENGVLFLNFDKVEAGLTNKTF